MVFGLDMRFLGGKRENKSWQRQQQ